MPCYQKEIVKGEEAITTLIDHLDAKKYEALERTFKGVAKNFADVFKELIPGGEGKMTMRCADNYCYTTLRQLLRYLYRYFPSGFLRTTVILQRLLCASPIIPASHSRY